MSSVLLWIGIGVIVLGWLALAWQASKRIQLKESLDRDLEKKDLMRRTRNYCFLIIFTGIVLLLIAMLI